MKAILTLLWILPLMGFAGSSSEDYRGALAETGVTARPPPPTPEDLKINPNFLEDIKKLPAERKEKLANQLARIIPRLAEEQSAELAQPVAPGESPVPRVEVPILGILILQEIGTDEQKIEAFRNLDLYGDSLSDACVALATCEGDRGVNILKQYAESQFAKLESNDGVRTPEGRVHVKPDVNIYLVVIALAGAYHADGPIAAEKLRDRLIGYFKSHVNATMLAAIEKDFAKDMGKARHRRENLIREKLPDNKRSLNTGSINKETSGPVSITSNKWFWPSVFVAAILLGLACWKLIRSKA